MIKINETNGNGANHIAPLPPIIIPRPRVKPQPKPKREQPKRIAPKRQPPRGGKPKGIIGRITEFFTTANNVITRHARVFTRRFVGIWRTPVDDWGRSDYDFWRRAARANVKGLELAALFIAPVISKIVAWSLTPAPQFRCENDLSQTRVNEWFGKNASPVAAWLLAALKVGDGAIVVNPDLSVTIVAADYVDPIVDEFDFSRRIGWRITQVFEHPTETRRQVIIDEYYADRRVHRVEIDGLTTVQQTYANLIGIIPVVVHANNPDEGQTFGYAEASSALNLLYRYNDVMMAGIEGNILQGRPTPVAKFDQESDLDKFWDLYGETDFQTMPDGTTEEDAQLNIDLSQLMTIAGGDFKFAQPGSFIGDTEKMLGLIFYLLLEHWQMPEFVFGNAISSSNASADAQMPIWENYIAGRQEAFTPSLLALAQIVNAFQSLIEPGVTAEEMNVQFAKLTQDGKLILEVLKWLYAEGMIDRRTAISLAPANIENIDEVLALALKEREEREQAALAQSEAELAMRVNVDRDREIERLNQEEI